MQVPEVRAPDTDGAAIGGRTTAASCVSGFPRRGFPSSGWLAVLSNRHRSSACCGSTIAISAAAKGAESTSPRTANCWLYPTQSATKASAMRAVSVGFLSGRRAATVSRRTASCCCTTAATGGRDGGFGVYLSDKAGVTVVARHRTEVFEKSADGGGGELVRKYFARRLLADRNDDVVLAGEVPIDRTVGQAGLGDDVGQGRPGEALAGESPPRSIHYLPAACIEVGLINLGHKKE